MRQRAREKGEAMSFGGVKQEVEVRANLETETEEQRIDQGVDHFYRASEHILRGQLQGTAHWKDSVSLGYELRDKDTYE